MRPGSVISPHSVLVPGRRIPFRALVQRLIEGIHKFRNEEFGHYAELFQRLASEGQYPHTLFITCSDSRVLAELITPVSYTHLTLPTICSV